MPARDSVPRARFKVRGLSTARQGDVDGATYGVLSGHGLMRSAACLVDSAACVEPSPRLESQFGGARLSATCGARRDGRESVVLVLRTSYATLGTRGHHEQTGEPFRPFRRSAPNG